MAIFHSATKLFPWGLISVMAAVTWMRRTRSIGLIGCMMAMFMLMGCGSSINAAPRRYREQHRDRGHLLPDMTVERLQGCVEEYGRQFDEDSLRVDATVELDQEGQTKNIELEGIPESAPDFASCARIALRDMTVTALPLRTSSMVESSNKLVGATGNEIANPAVFVEIAIVLGEFMAEHGGKIVLYAVTVEVLGAAGVYAYGKLSKRCRRVKTQCIDSCGDSDLPTGTYSGDPFHACMRQCMERAGCF